MNIQNSSVWQLVVLISFFGVPSARGDSPLKHVPADSLLVVQVRGIEQAARKLQTTMDHVLPDSGLDVLTFLESFVGNTAGVAKLRGLSQSGPDFLVFRGTPSAKDVLPAPELLLRVTDYAALQAQLAGCQTVLKRDGEYVAIGLDEEVVESLVADRTGLDEKIASKTAATMLTSDLAVYVRPSSLNAECGDKLRLALEAARSASNKPRGVKNPETRLLSKALEAKSLLLAFDFRSEGITLHLQHERAGRAPPRKNKPDPLCKLGDLPGGFSQYSETTGASTNSIERYAQKIHDPKLANAFRDIATRAGVRRFRACSLPGRLRVYEASKPQLLTLLELTIQGQRQSRKTTDDDTKNVEYRGFRLYRRDDAEFPTDEEKERAKNTVFAVFPGRVGESLFDVISKQAEDLGSSWFGHNDNLFVEVSAANWEGATEIIDRFLSSTFRLAQEPGFADCRRQLPSQSNELSVLRCSALTGLLTKWTDLAVGESRVTKDDGSYLGLSTFEDGILAGYDVWIPAAALRAFGESVRPLLEALRKE